MLAVLLLAATPVCGVVSYNFDFGINAYSGNDGGAAGLVLNMGDWVQVTGDLVHNGLTLDCGRGAGASEATIVSWATSPKADISMFYPGRLAVPNLFEDGIGGSQNQQSIVGLRVSGLAPGVYDVFATVHIESPTNLSTATGSVWLGTGGGTVTSTNQVVDAVSRPWCGFAPNQAEFVSTAGNWNYISNRVTVAVGDYVVLIGSLPFASGNQKLYEPIVSSLQIVAIPEPGTLLLAGLGLFVFTCLRRKTRSNAMPRSSPPTPA